MKKKGLSQATIKTRTYLLSKLIKLGADLNNPDTVETIIATHDWKNPYKKNYANAYKAYTNYKKIQWEKPKITITQKEPFLPTDEEVKQLISGTSKTVSTLIQLLYETGIRIGEANALQWTDIDLKSNQIRINCPEKGSNARTLKISDTLTTMLNKLTRRKDNNIFNPRTRTISTIFSRQRKRLAEKLQNPRIKQIHFHTLRHLKATTEYYKTKDILHVKYILGHKRLDTTQRYAHYQPFQKEKYHCKVAKTQEEITDLIENGFEYVTEQEGLKYFRKRK
ncbi:MAG: tyrosine-type recombinase/integrase [Candidatus Bathyarchaeota archaeon]|nr:tyrosine-type recombinase/integrase [Candidatus Bathyarchaeum sp.]